MSEAFAPARDPSSASGRGARTKDDLADERDALHAATTLEIQGLAAAFADRMPRERAREIGVIYARYSTKFQASVVDQVRDSYEAAVRHEIFVPAHHVCFDQATRSGKRDRPGLSRMVALLQSGAARVLLAFTTNRLHRKVHRCLQFVEEELVERGLRAIFVKSGIDTADAQRWKMLLNFHATMDEFVGSMYAENVRTAQEGLFDRGMVFGTYPLGYRGVPVDGQVSRRNRPRCRLAIDPETAPWVEKIFRWFAEESGTLAGIIRRLNADPSAPRPPHSQSGSWSLPALRGALTNPRYRGYWEYGRVQKVWQSRKDYARSVPRQVPLRAAQVEALRIVPDSLWAAAQVRLAAQARVAAGRRPRGSNNSRLPRMLNGLFYCPTYDCRLSVAGANAEYMLCRDCQGIEGDDRPLVSYLPRALALKLTCRALAELVAGDAGLTAATLAACRAHAEQDARPDPAELEKLRRRRRGLDEKIRFLMRNPGETEADRREAAIVLRELRRERDGVRLEVGRREEAADRPAAVPTDEEAGELLGGLTRLLEATAAGGPGTNHDVARDAIELLTGGRIDLEQCGGRSRRAGWLRGRFRSRLLPYLATASASPTLGVGVGVGVGVEVVVDYRSPAKAEALADAAGGLSEGGMLLREIAERLGIQTRLASRALAVWRGRRGDPRLDGRARRATLDRKSVETPKYALLADAAKALRDEGLSLNAVAARLGCNPWTSKKAWVHWHTLRGLPAPETRSTSPPAALDGPES